MMIAPELRQMTTALVLRDVQTVGKPYRYLEGRAVPYGELANVGWYLEAHRAGSFGESTKAGTGKGLPLLLFHDNRSFPIGRAETWAHDAGGLDGVWRLNESPEAQRAAAAAEDGELVGMSVGFSPIRSDWEYVDDWNPDLGPDHMDRVERVESRLLEVSLTPTPAFEQAAVTAVRTALTVEHRHAAAAAAGHGPRSSQVDTWRLEVERLRSASH
jgi:hypothetical protein